MEKEPVMEAFDLGESPSALIVIDMQHGFIDATSSLCIVGAQETVPACARVLDTARRSGVPVIYALRRYAPDGSDVEAARLETWLADRALSDGCDDPHTCDVPVVMAPKEGDRVIFKPRYSAFFGTGLDVLLRRLGVQTVVLIGTTTPNCVRSSCYDALSLDYNVVIIEDCTSSRTPEVQEANIEDMAHIGAQIINVETFCSEGLESIRDIVGEHRARIAQGC